MTGRFKNTKLLVYNKLSMIERLFQKKNTAQTFWNWFSKNKEIYFYLEKNLEALFSKLKTELEKIHPDLVFEFSPLLQDGTREFVISADGIKSISPVVIDLVKQAPKLKNWKIVQIFDQKSIIPNSPWRQLLFCRCEISHQPSLPRFCISDMPAQKFTSYNMLDISFYFSISVLNTLNNSRSLFSRSAKFSKNSFS